MSLAPGNRRAAIEAGYGTLFVTHLVAALAKANSEGRLEEKLRYYGKPKLLIVDELGYLPLERNAAHLFFQLIVRRYERGSILLTSSRSVGEWVRSSTMPSSLPPSSTDSCTTATS